MSYEFINFPDKIKVKIGVAWLPEFPSTSPAPFLTGDTIILTKVGVTEYDGMGILTYSESGSYGSASPTNRLKIIYSHLIEYSYKALEVYVYDGTEVFVTATYLSEETAYTFDEVFEARLGTSDVEGYFDWDGNTYEYWLNPLMFPYYQPYVFASLSGILSSMTSIAIPFLSNIAKLMNSFGMQSLLSKLPQIGSQGVKDSSNSIGVYAQGIVRSVNNIISSSLQGILKGLNLIDATTISQGSLRSGNAIGSLAMSAIYPTVVWDILLDGVSIKNKILDLSIQISESSIHNSVSLSSSDIKLYQTCNPYIFNGENRITITVGTRTFYFLIEQRTGDRNAFSVFGRSLTALLDAPFSETLDYIMSISDTASNVAQDISGNITTDWNVDDFILNDDFAFNGIRIEGLNLIADSLGAIIRSKDNGNILIRYKLQVRPVNLSSAIPEIEYTADSNLITLDFQENQGTHENIIQVDGKSTEIELPTLEVEDSLTGSTHKIGEDIFIRAFWGVENPPEITEMYSTDGQCKLIKNATTEIKTEIVTFEDGKATTQYPIVSVSNVRWIGMSGGTGATFKKFSNEIYVAETDIRIAEVVYTTVYQRYKISGHVQENIIFVLVINSTDVSIQINMQNSDKEAGSLQKEYIKDKALLAKIGKNYLDDNSYDSFEVFFEAPYNDLATDGKVVSVFDDKILLSGNFLIKDCSIIFSGAKVTNKIRAVKYII